MKRSNGLTLSLLVDQHGAKTGGGRFTTNFCRAIEQELEIDDRIAGVYFLATEKQPANGLGMHAHTQYHSYRVPARLRGTILGDLVATQLPRADVGHGLFNYVFAGQGRSTVVTVHDVSVIHEQFHPLGKRAKWLPKFADVLRRANAIVCSSEATRGEMAIHFPQYVSKCTRIYCGTEGLPQWRSSAPANLQGGATVLDLVTVGTIEPRKNYDRILDAYELVMRACPEQVVRLTVIGAPGWRCDHTVKRLERLERDGKVRWLRNATDADIEAAYQKAAAFAYLSVYEGFGYPPFEAALAGIPMLLSDASSIGEIWRGYAECVDPRDVRAIARSWCRLLALTDEQRSNLIDRQRKRAKEFSWQRCIKEHLDLYEELNTR